MTAGFIEAWWGMLKRIIPVVGFAWGALVGAGAAIGAPAVMLEDFDAAAPRLDWQIVNDGVMGGLSQSRLTWVGDGVARFSGELSLRNNGGFASIRSNGRLPDLKGHDAVVLRVKGDGRRFEMRVAHRKWVAGTGLPGGVSDAERRMAGPHPALGWILWRGRTLRDAPPIEAGQIRSIGIWLGDKKAGSFDLEIDWIGMETVGAEAKSKKNEL
ncbi:MAG: CIA30 family protein [Candidatus Synoicihabitans palmerolidicus]|nr:CIA30 family protein [Candidatus Synoicihabitans palmerolidicus]